MPPDDLRGNIQAKAQSREGPDEDIPGAIEAFKDPFSRLAL